MKIIGIETSSIQGGVAILETKRCVRDKSNQNESSPCTQGLDESIILIKQLLLKKGLVHGKLLIPALEKLLAKSHWQKEDIDLVAVDIGPGSYTGLRVGLAIAKTISYIIKSKIVGVFSLDVLVANIHHNNYQYICPVVDARWNQVYAAIYDKGQPNNILKYNRISDYLAISPQDLVRLLKRYLNKADEKLLLFGDGLKAYKDPEGTAIGTVKGETLSEFNRLIKNRKILVGSNNVWFPKAVNVALLGYESYKKGRCDDPIKLIPLYLRLTEAEINLKAKSTK